jgi:hypothetical protein
MKIVTHHDCRISQIPDSVVSQVHDSRASQVHDSGASRIPAFRLLQPPDSRISRQSHILKQVKSSNTKDKFGHYFILVQKLVKHSKYIKISSWSPLSTKLDLSSIIDSRTCFMNFDNSTFRGCKCFIELPNTSPSGKWVDSDDPFPRKLSNFGKKCHPRNVGVHMCPPENSQRSNRGDFLKLPPLALINRGVHTVKFFYRALDFSELSPTFLHRGSSRQRAWRFGTSSTL